MYYSYSLVWFYSLSQLSVVGACFAVYLSVCQIVRLSTPEPLKITVKDRSKQKYFSDIIFGPVLVFAFNSRYMVKT